jgi:Glycosyl transferase family 2
MADFRVVAIISAFNEADVISPVIGHLVENGVEVYLIDNRSTDGTAEAAKRWLRKGLLGIEQFPAEAPAGEGPPPFDWEAILKRKEALTKELSADWFIHHDADEFREAPWPGMKLRDAIRWVDRLGYNCIDFRVLNFPPLENGFQPGADPREHFTHWEDPVVYDTLQRKSWKAQAAPVSLAASGGHEARFPGRRVFPIRFLLRHYPIRSQEHGLRKVFDERKKRFVDKERAKGWHVQYDSIADENHSFLGDPGKLQLYDPDRVRLDLLVDSEPARTARERTRELTSLGDSRQKDLEIAAALKHEAEKHAANVEEDRRRIVERLVDRERHVANLETTKAQLESHAAGLEREREALVPRLADRERHAANLENTLGHLQRHADGLEKERDRLAARLGDRERHAANLETTVAQLERHAAALEKDRETLEGIRADRERHIGHLEAGRAEAQRHAAELAARVEGLGRDNAALERALGEVRASRSWRWTAPLRRLFSAFRD